VVLSERISSTRDLERENDSLPCLFPPSGKEEVDEPDVDLKFEEVDESEMFLFLGPPARVDTAEREEYDDLVDACCWWI
jgi:hypothetical protein